ncbi:MAG TPA: hypothetical protein VMI56_18260 [Reyranella sp.]|nr:hypothetical protein [Reyranella sp.]
MLGRLALVLGSILFSLIVLELGTRLVVDGPAGLVHWPNLVLLSREQSKSSAGPAPFGYDARLGFVPRPGRLDARRSYGPNGYRATPAPDGIALAEPPILVVGDSYAHGDELADGETWASRLQAFSGRRVVNAAVSAYGLDQIVLRAELAAADVKPAALVLSFIPDDTRRSEMRRVWGAEKPYFEIAGGKLVERNVPVPPSPRPADTLDVWQWLFGWSELVDVVLKHQGWQYEWAVDHERVLPRGEGVRLACFLFKRLAALDLPTLVVAEHDPYTWQNADYAGEKRAISAAVLACARQAGFATLDLFDTIDAAVKAQGLARIYGVNHPSPAGAALVARRIASELEADHIPPR